MSVLPTPEPADPVEGQPGHFEHSNWLKQSVKNLDDGKVNRSGDTMTGALQVGEPVGPLDAANKGYVDSRIWHGTKAEYDAIAVKDPDTLYAVRW